MRPPKILIDIRHTICSLTAVLICGAVAGVVAATLWASIDWLRNYGTGYSPQPPFGAAQLGGRNRIYPASSFMGALEDLIDWYNSTFQGAARFGSGFGIIAGMCIALSCITRYSLAVRLVSGIICGGIIGGRIMLMLTSDVRYFLSGMIAGSVIGGIALARAGMPSKLAPLPLLRLGRHDD